MKFKLTLTAVIEYDVNTEDYPGGNTQQEMLEVDLNAAIFDPPIFIDYFDDVSWNVIGEIVEV